MPDPYFSEIQYLGAGSLDFIEIAVDAGTDVSNLVVTIYNSNGTVRSTNAIAGLTHTTVFGRDVYVVESGSPSSFSGLHKFGGVALSDSGTVHSFVSFDDNAATITATEGPANGLTSTEIGQAGSGNSLETTDDGATYTVQTSPNSGTIPCLTKGTNVQTDKGAVKVEDLKAGMRLLTLDGTYAPLRLVLSKPVTVSEHRKNAKLAPVRIKAGALGHGLPKVDLLVSRQHRMLVSSSIAKRMFNKSSVLVAAIRLTELPGVYVDREVEDIRYYHLLFDQHCIVFAENAPTESLFVGEEIISVLPSDSMAEIKLLFPQLLKSGHKPKPACFIPDRQRQKQLMQRHAKNARYPLSLFKGPLPLQGVGKWSLEQGAGILR